MGQAKPAPRVSGQGAAPSSTARAGENVGVRARVRPRSPDRTGQSRSGSAAAWAERACARALLAPARLLSCHPVLPGAGGRAQRGALLLVPAAPRGGLFTASPSSDKGWPCAASLRWSRGLGRLPSPPLGTSSQTRRWGKAGAPGAAPAGQPDLDANVRRTCWEAEPSHPSPHMTEGRLALPAGICGEKGPESGSAACPHSPVGGRHSPRQRPSAACPESLRRVPWEV